MDKRRTIYKLVDLRACILLTMLNLLSGVILFVALKSIPRVIESKLEEYLLAGMEGSLAQKMQLINELVHESVLRFYGAAFEAIGLSVLALVCIMILIRLNGQLNFRKLISWLVVGGVSLINLTSMSVAFRFMHSGSVAIARHGLKVFIALGLFLFAAGLILLFFKLLKDLTQPASVL